MPVFWSILINLKQGSFNYGPPVLSRLRFSCSLMSADGGSPFSVDGLDFFTCWLCMATYRVHDKGLKSSGAEGTYCDKQCFTVWLFIFPVKVRTSYSSEHLFREFLEMKVWCHI